MRKSLSILLLLFIGHLQAMSQSPGGVEGCEAWFVTSPSNTDLNGSYTWQDLSGDSVPLRHVGGTQNGTEVLESRNVIQTFNFHPALRFSPSSGFMDAILRHTNLAQTTFIGVFAPDTLIDTRLYAFSGKDTTAITKDNVYHSGRDEAIDYSPDLIHSQAPSAALKIVSWQRTLTPKYSPWGEVDNATLSFGGGALGSNPAFSSALSNLGSTPGFSGWCPELIVYGRMLTPYERVNIETLLALKYGITLDGSYYYKDRLLWDVASDPFLRITGIINDSTETFRQSISTTSYEEQPRLSTLPANDSFFGRDSYGKSSSNRLLTMGRFFTDDIPDDSYMMWGDNGGATSTTATGRNWHTMGRRWLVRTDIDTTAVDTMVLTRSNLELTAKGNMINITANTTGNPSLTLGPMTSSDLHFGFTCPVSNVSFFIGTARQDSTSCSEGYYFDDGNVYKVVWGEQEQAPFLTDMKGHDIDIFKWGDHLYLQVDGSGDASYNIIVPLDELTPSPFWDDEDNGGSGNRNSGDDMVIETDQRYVDNNRLPGYKCWGLIKPACGTILQGIRIDGFVDTGTYAELSYAIAGGGEFKPYRLGRTFLLAKGGSGTRAYRCAGFDPERKKILFHQLALADRDTITFAWNDGLLADVDAEPACHGNDGKINIHVHNSGPVLSISYTNRLTRATVGMPYPESSRENTISGLTPAVYDLSLIQEGMNNLRAWTTTDTEYMTASLPSGNNDISWKYDGSGNEYVAGFRVSGTSVKFGVKLRNDTAWFIRNGSLYSPRQVSAGATFHVKYVSGKVYVKINGTQVTNSATKNSNWLFRARFGRGVTVLKELSGIGGNTTFSNDRVMLESVKADTLCYEVHIGSECNGSTTYVVPQDVDDGFNYRLPRINDKNLEDGTNPLTVTNGTPGGQNITAVLSTDATDGPVQMLIFDAAGRLHHKGRVINSPPYIETFGVDAPGVYLIKAITPSGEYTNKVACGQ